jgi:hypothetical protein
VRGSVAGVLLACAALGAAAASAQGPECIVIDDFSRARLGAFPTDWKPRKDSGLSLYSVLEENGLRFLRAVSRGHGIQAARQREWSLTQYPVLVWRWRPREFPTGADERESDTNDSALAVYLFVPYSRIAGPKAVKYIWSEKVPTGTLLTSNAGLTQVRVLRTGRPPGNDWLEERVDALADYRRLFREAATPTPAGIGVLTDSDDTRSRAQGDYANFRACRN